MSVLCDNWTTWLKKTRFSYMSDEQILQTIKWLLQLRDEIIRLAEIKEGHTVADFGCGNGLLAFGIIEKYQDKVKTIFSDKFEDCIQECKKILLNSNAISNASFIQSDIADIKIEDNMLDRALTRSVLVHVKDKQPAFNELYRVLKPSGMYCAFEPIISQNTRYWEILDSSYISDYEKFKNAENEFMENPQDPLVNFCDKTLKENMQNSGFSNININVNIVSSTYTTQKDKIFQWFINPPAPDQKTMKERFLQYFSEKDVDNYIEEVCNYLNEREITINSKTALIKAIK